MSAVTIQLSASFFLSAPSPIAAPDAKRLEANGDAKGGDGVSAVLGAMAGLSLRRRKLQTDSPDSDASQPPHKRQRPTDRRPTADARVMMGLGLGLAVTDPSRAFTDASRACTDASRAVVTDASGRETRDPCGCSISATIRKEQRERRRTALWQRVLIVSTCGGGGVDEGQIVFEFGVWAPITDPVFRTVFDVRRLDGMRVGDAAAELRAAVTELETLEIPMPSSPPEDKTRRSFAVFAWYINVLAGISETYQYSSSRARPLVWKLPIPERRPC